MQAIEPRTAEDRIALLERRLARAEFARQTAEALLEKRSRALAITNERLAAGKEALERNLARRDRQLLNAQRVAGIGTMLWDFGKGRLELSPQLFGMFHLPQDELVTSYRPLLRRVVGEDRRKLLRWIHQDVLSGMAPAGCEACGPNPEAASCAAGADGDGGELPARRCSSDDYQIDLRCRNIHGDATPRWVRVMAQFEFGDDCTASLLFATVQDINRQVQADEEAEALRQREQRRVQDLERLNQELIVARENALRANAAKSRFLAMMSHDIRTPLNGVLGMLSLLDETTLEDRQRRMLDLVRSSGDQLRVLLNDIIDLARAEAGKLQLSPALTNLRAVLTESADFWRSLAREKNLTLALTVAPNLPEWVEIDRVRFRQLLDNLLSNAIKYTQLGSIGIHAAFADSTRLVITVTDTGIGIPPERRAELFEDFGQLNLLGSEPGGAGLGLAICQRITETMGGTIGVRDADGGSCFWFEIPCPPQQPPQAAPRPASLALRGPGGRAPHVLVAEDISTNRIVVEGYLRKLGCTMRMVENGQLALEAAEQEAFDLVLMDMAMPVMDGPEATRRIRALGDGRGQVPIIALTAFARAEELAPMMAAGANGSVAKPIVLRDLQNAIAQALER